MPGFPPCCSSLLRLSYTWKQQLFVKIISIFFNKKIIPLMKSEYEIPPVKQNRLFMEGHSLSSRLPMFVMHKETLAFVGFMFLYPLNFIFLIIKLQLFQIALSPGYSEVVCLYSHLLYINTCSE